MRKKVLLVEDDIDAREIARVILELHGYEVVEAHDGIDALHKSLELSPDIVILDMSIMPWGGIQTMRTIRKDSPKTSIPILAYTALASIDERELLKREGFDDVITKPCSPDEIVATVRKFIG